MAILSRKVACTCAQLLSTFCISSVSNASLVGRDLDGNLSDFEAYYDDVLNITWLADANHAQTSGYDADGAMTWADANTWASSLTLGGYTGWRLANTVDVGNNGCTYTNLYEGVDCGYNITSLSEMSHLFYETLGNLARYDTTGTVQSGWGLTNSGPFSNIVLGDYWSATSYATDSTLAWKFTFHTGYQDAYASYKIQSRFAWAVHDGDIGTAASASAVPVPAAAWLFGSALAGFASIRARKI